MKKFLLRLDEELFDKANNLAQDKNVSLNKYINDILIKEVGIKQDTNFERRNIVGTLVKGSSIVESKELIEVAGIYYKYQLVESAKINKDSFYEIVKAIGNVIYIKQEEND
ncbi:hypothetical protein RD055328_01330 [Companilactobacillus sp. RD055328]|uniref:toxin-antitoxin system HicB family antitoxin n=1 Tax=Companilactobacillus sp. RD055328 TaxID=2916634 RepID=UPI001FC809E4|nr:toxin-antitoxin system HicB family antitoxin [Companilactobacillus sp. RD055328]GKQ42210.1 hypothetical protein RD055328_01330 [Companilactobacillus sp. RD055328]